MADTSFSQRQLRGMSAAPMRSSYTPHQHMPRTRVAVVARILRLYWKIAQMSLQDVLAYRWHVAFEFVAFWVVAGVTLLVWKYIPLDNAHADLSRDLIMLHVVLASTLMSVVHTSAAGDDVSRMINRGELTFLLIRPMHPTAWFFISNSASRIAMTVLGIAAGAGMIAVFRLWPHEWEWTGILYVMPFLILGSVLQFFLFHVMGSLSFWLQESWGVRLLVSVAVEVASGALVPLSLFHPIARSIFEALPFKFFGAVPAQFFMHVPSWREYSLYAAHLLLWIAAMWMVHAYVWRKGIRAYDGSGQ